MRVLALLCSVTIIALLLASCSDSSNSISPRQSTLSQATVNIPSKATPAFTPGTPGVVVQNEKILRHFGSSTIDFNQARYTRYFLSNQESTQPDGIVILVPGFEGGASYFSHLAENLLRRATEEANLVLELWAVDRRSNHLEDSVGLEIAEERMDPQIGLDFLFGDSLGLTLSPALAGGPNRRAIYYNSNADTAFMAQWTTLVHSQDIDAIVDAARNVARSGNVFLGGHSAGTGFTANYAATDFDLTGEPVDPGYRKLRGLILLEGSGARLAMEPTDETTLNNIEARFDGGLYTAIRDQLPRCSDALTPCTAETAETDCAAFNNPACAAPGAYTEFAGLLSTQLFGAAELVALDATVNDQSTLSILLQDQNEIEGNNASLQVPELNILLPLVGSTPASSITLLGKFIDDDGPAAGVAAFLATSVGFEGPVTDGLATWLSKSETQPADALTDNGPAPTSLDGGQGIGTWGQEIEATDLEGVIVPMFYLGETNFVDWYYPSSGLSVTDGIGWDTTALSAPPPLGRGRSDIENRTQATAIDIPVIAFGGSNGFATAPAAWLGFADAIAPCATSSCDGMSDRVLDRLNPNEAFPTFGGIAGGFEVYISEGYSHVDVLTADDDESNNVVGPLLEFVQRNLQ